MRQDENPQLMRGKVPQTLRGVTTGVDWVDSRLSGDANRGASSPLPGAHEDKTAGPSVAPVPPWTGRDEAEAADTGVAPVPLCTGRDEDETAGAGVAQVPPWTGRDEDEATGAGVAPVPPPAALSFEGVPM